MECRRYTAAEAQAWGLVHRVVPGASFAKEVRTYAEALRRRQARVRRQIGLVTPAEVEAN